MSDVAARVSQLSERLVAWRRDFHRYPEPGFCEFRTASAVIQELRGLGYEVTFGSEAMDLAAAFSVPRDRISEWHERATESEVADPELLEAMADGSTAVVADLQGALPGPTIAFRFDMDALPLAEARDPGHRPFAEGFTSVHDGYMHACGHDGHTAIGLGVATVLAELRDSLAGTVRVIFQPAEEGAPGGAAAIAARGFVDDVDFLLCFHLGLEARSLGHVVCRTEFLATSKYRVTFTGQPSHVVNSPQTGRNALLAAASAALAVHGLAPSSEGWFSVNVGVLRAGTEQGITPAHATMDLGFWATTPAAQEYVRGRVLEIVRGTALTWRVEVDVAHIGEAPAAPQDEELARVAADAARSLSAAGPVDDFAACRAGEDATVLLQRVHEQGGRGVYLLVGADLANGHHASTFDFDERALQVGTALLGTIALELMR